MCPGGVQAPTQRRGYWVDVANSDVDRRVYSVIRCRNVLECLDGPFETCAAGRQGIGCGNCEDRHYRAREGRCPSCGLQPFFFFWGALFGQIYILFGEDVPLPLQSWVK